MLDSASHHIVLTRFNVRMGFSTDRRLSPDWLTTRFRLFDRFCYASLRGQTCHDFTWLVLFDSETPDEFRERISEYAGWDRFDPVYIPDFDTVDLDALVREHMPGRVNRLITSRIDNDDAYCRTYVADVQQVAQSQQQTVINFASGLYLDLSRCKLYRSLHSTSPFSSFVEEVGSAPLRTIFGEEHNLVQRLGPIHQVAGEPAWLAVVHGGNVLNRVKLGTERLPLDILASRFAVDVCQRRESRTGIALENRATRILSRIRRAGFRAASRVKRAVA